MSSDHILFLPETGSGRSPEQPLQLVESDKFLPSAIKGGKAKKSSPGQMILPWNKQRVTESTEVHTVADKFIAANRYQPPVPGIGFLKCWLLR